MKTVAFALFVLMVAGCATVRRVVSLRERDDLARVPEARDRYVMPDSTGPFPPLLGHLSADSLVVYRRIDAHERPATTPAYRRDLERVSAPGVAIAGFTSASGEHVSYEGWVRRVGDSLWFEPRPRRGMEARGTRIPIRRHVVQVRSVDAWLPDAGYTAIAITAVIVVVLAGAAGWAASQAQEPLV